LLLASAGNTTTLWLDMQWYSHIAFLIECNNAAGPTGAAITLNQGQTVLGTGSKALVYNNYFAATGGFGSQAATADVWTQVTGVSGTFTTANTASTKIAYIIEVQDTDLDLTGGAGAYFNAVQLAIGAGAANTTFTVSAFAFPRYDGYFTTMPSALT
jgi:hypothetical protein